MGIDRGICARPLLKCTGRTIVSKPYPESSRRVFMKTAAVGTAAALAAPAIVTAKKTDGNPIIGTGDYQYEAIHHWPQLPSKYSWQVTHNVAIDSEGLLYVIHEGNSELKDHPNILVFDQEGKYVRSFGQHFQGGGHGIDIRNEDGQDFLYVTAFGQRRSVAKLDTKGEQLWRKGAPMQSGVYAEGEDDFHQEREQFWDRRTQFNPTNVAFLPDGGFFLADGYGAYRVHRYDRDANWVSMFGEPSGDDKQDGTFRLPHGIWIDDRGEESLVVIADRANDRMQWFSMDGEHRETKDGFLLPANIDILGDVMLVPELVARTTLLDKDNQVIAHLGTDSERIQKDLKETGGFSIRADESQWLPGKFIHPHDACFDKDGNIFLAEWVATGRVTKLRRL